MPLDNTGLIVRYYIDEAASGSAPSAVLDGSGVGTAFDLTLNYGGGNLAYTEVSGNRGLVSSATTGTQRASKDISTTDKVYTNLNGATKATLEVVVNITSFNGSGGRIFGINDRVGSTGIFMFRGISGTEWEVAVNNSVRQYWNGTESTRQVIHIVYDSTQSTASDRIKVYVDGSLISTSGFGGTSLNETLSLIDASDVTMLNRESSGSFDRSAQATLFYAALYSDAFSSSRVTDHYNVLTADDDTPAGVAASFLLPRNPMAHMVVR